jgi:hypothetical protein
VTACGIEAWRSWHRNAPGNNPDFRIYCWIEAIPTMGTQSQARALQNYRRRLREKGLGRFEVLGLQADRELIRAVARRLAEDSPDAAEIRRAILSKVADKPAKRGGILKALRSSPLVGEELELTRPRIVGRRVRL